MEMNFLNMKWKYIRNRKIEKKKTYNKDAYIQKVKNSSSITFIMNKWNMKLVEEIAKSEKKNERDLKDEKTNKIKLINL